MPLTTTRAQGGPRRRRVLAQGAAALLAGGASALLTGCSSEATGADENASAARRLRERARADSAALLEQYDAVIAAHAALADRLRPLRDEVARHAEAFAARGASAPPPASPSPAPSAGAGGGGGTPLDEKSALATLADAERRAADARTAALGTAPPELARLLASVAAAGAAHAYLLTGGD
ncbi:hypothetical protein [Streptomyces cinnamoneus]|uniref:hypothetical protein n=1 Tax=Streptomyces cinnamoneus TaxID=53446 RepID=UPI0026BF713D